MLHRLFSIIVNGLLLCSALIFNSCSNPPSVVNVSIPPKSIPPLETKIYPLPGFDWSTHSHFALDLQQKGSPETSHNQILEKYLSTQVVECLRRKGFDSAGTDPDIRVRLYFGVKEEKIITGSILGYGLAGQSTTGYLTQYNLASGVWNTASLAATEWSVQTVHQETSVYKGEISIEVFDKENITQLWRGDVRAPLTSDDIRLVSHWMIRELFWSFPSLDYPAFIVPEVRVDEFDEFWNSFISDKEFYSPGQKFPISFVGSRYDLPTAFYEQRPLKGMSEEEKELLRSIFEKTDEYRSIADHDDQYLDRETYRLFLVHKLRPKSEMAAMEEIRGRYSRYAVAIADLLQTAPWSIITQNNTILMAGRYFIGDDEQSTIIEIEGRPQTYKTLQSESQIYNYQKYFVTKIYIIAPGEFRLKWEQVQDFRKMAVGKIDFVPSEPSPAIRHG